MDRRLHALLTTAAFALAAGPAGAQSCPAREPVIDVHLHVYAADPRLTYHVPDPATGAPPAANDGPSHTRALIAALEREGVVRGIVDAEQPAPAQAAAAQAKGRLVLGYQINDIPTQAQLDEIRTLHAQGRIVSIGEIGLAYAGVRLDDPRLEPLWALAEELDLPVMLHTGSGPPDAWRNNPRNRIRAGDVLGMEDAIVRHPKLRVVLQHMGWPMADDTVAMLNAYSQVYVDTAAIDWLAARPEFHAYLKRLVDAGYGKRILFGSDAMAWPQGVGLAIEGVRSADFLTPGQKRDILYGNAARLFGWKDLPGC